MSHRRSAGVVGVLLLLVLAATACGDDESSDVATSPSGGPGTSQVTTTAPSSATTTADSPATTTDTAPGPTSPPVTSPPATDPPATIPPGRTVALGESFSLTVGETVTIPSEGLSVTFGNAGPDNRCPPGVQCIVAGNASIGVTVAKAGAAPVILALNTDEGPKSGPYGSYTVELVRLSFGSPPVATLRVT